MATATKAKPRDGDEDHAADALPPPAGADADAAGSGAAAEAGAVDAFAPAGGITLVPLQRLKLAADNVRRGGKGDVEQLAADIAAHGLLQNLVGWEDPVGLRPAVFIVAGGRRLKALELLKRQGAIPADHPVPVQIVTPEAGREMSLAENFQRIAMNAGEEAEAFGRLAAQGVAVAEIAQRFGLTEMHVRQRLRLADLAPAVLDALKAGKISLDVAKAFASVPDQARQAEVLKARGRESWFMGNPDAVRREMRGGGLPAVDFLAAYVGERAYIEAGGRIEADLFSEAFGRLWLDGALARQLAETKLAADAEAMRAEAGLGGVVWGIRNCWEETRELIPYEFEGELGALPADVRAGLVGAVALVPSPDKGWQLVLDDSAWLRDASTAVPVGPEFPAVPGEPDAPAEPEADAGDDPASGSEPGAGEPPEPEPEGDQLKPLPGALLDALAMRRRDALALALLQDTTRARDLALFLTCELIFQPVESYPASSIGIPFNALEEPVKGELPWRANPDGLAQALEEAAACGNIEEAGEDPVPFDDGWRHLKTAGDRWAAFLELPVEERYHWGALALGRTLRAWGHNYSRTRSPLQEAVAESLGLTEVSPTMWRPTAENYFDRAGKARCLQFLEEVGLGDTKPWAKWKKLELSSACEALAAGDSSKLGGLGSAMPGAIEAAAKAWMPRELSFPAAA